MPTAWPGWLALATVAALVAVAAVGARVPLLWDDAYAPGYDGYYYVIQARSLLAGDPLFADRSLVHPFLAGLGVVTGDVVLGNKIAACAFAAIGSAGAAIGAARWIAATQQGGSGPRGPDLRPLAAGLAAGLCWGLLPSSLVVSGEFLKNAGGLALLGGLLAVLPGRRGWAGHTAVVILVAAGLLTHKLTGVMGLGLTGLDASLRLDAWLRRRRRRAADNSSAPGTGPGWRTWALAGLAFGVLALAAGAGVLRLVDLSRLIRPQTGLDRWWALFASGRVGAAHQMELALIHALPLLLPAGMFFVPRRLLPLGLAGLGLAALSAAPALSFSFEATAWRLMLMAPVPLALTAALLVARTHALAAVPIGALALAHLPWTVPHTAAAEPDYGAFAPALPALQATVPPGDRVVAHRGLCGFIQAEGDRRCENFDPQGTARGWWRVTWGVPPHHLARHGDPVALVGVYLLIPEATWRAFRAAAPAGYPLLRHPRNPFEPRPAYVYGPDSAPPRTDPTTP